VEDPLDSQPEIPMQWTPVHQHRYLKQPRKQIRNATAKKAAATNVANRDILSKHALPKAERPLPER